MLQQVLLSQGRAHAVVGTRGLLPSLRHVRAYGFGSHVSDNDPDIIEKEKKKHLAGKHVDHVPDVPGWNERLASDSEAVVKAEGSESANQSIEEMQKQTVEIVTRETQVQVDNEFGDQPKRDPPSGALGNA